MYIFKTSGDFLAWRKSLSNVSVGFVPTMGALHEGHLSLVRKCVDGCDVTVVSIFINPLQFADNEDLDSYPADINGDIEKLKSMDVSAVFVPDRGEIYRSGDTFCVDENSLSMKLEGKSRPHFFKGVLTVVAKLFNLVTPARAYFGRKDAQQLILIQNMVQSLGFPIDIVPCDTIREHNGLAMSSRNEYLSREQRDTAKIIFFALTSAKKLLDGNQLTAHELKNSIIDILSSEKSLIIDYVSVASLFDLSECEGGVEGEVLISVAVIVGSVRLIDNIFYTKT